MKRGGRRYLHLRIPKRLAVWTLAALALGGLSYEVLSETMTLTTYYPSPSGVYKRLAANFLQMKSYAAVPAEPSVCTTAGVAAPCLPNGRTTPEAGQLFYNKDRDKLYYSSKDALPGDASTWYKPVSGFESTEVAAGNGAEYRPPGGTTAINQWTAGTTTPATTVINDGKVVRGALQPSGGLYTLEVSGHYCTTDATPAAPTIYLYWRRWTSGGAASWQLVATDNTPDPTDLDGGCADIVISGMVPMSRARSGIDGLVKIREFSPSGNASLTNLHYSLTKVLSF